jgi:hypothetical protein
MTAQVQFVLGAEQIGRQSHIVKIEFGCLDLSLGDVGVPGLEQENNVARLQQGEPASCCRMRYPPTSLPGL